MQPTIILLKSGSDVSQGRPQLISNINAVQAVVDILGTTLGPRGMDKLIHSKEHGVTISNDGATIIKLLDIVHPAAKTLVDVARSQDAEVGDGTTSVCLLSAALLKQAKPFVEDGVHPQILIRGYRQALNLCLQKMSEIAVEFRGDDVGEQRSILERCAATSLNSKLISDYKAFFAPIVVDALLALDQNRLDLDLVGIKKVPGGSVTDSTLIKGVAFKKTFSYAGFEQQPKKFIKAKIVVLNVELELKSEKENAEIRISNPDQYQSIVDAEWKIIYDKLDLIVKSGANVILSRLPIGDLATQYFADRNLHCSGRVPDADLKRVCQATGAKLQTSLQDLSKDIIGFCDLFEERQVGGERYNVFTGCPTAKTATIILRGGAEQFIAETERSLHDAIMIVKRTLQHKRVVGGAGSIEMQLSKALREHASTIKDKQQLVMFAFARALECIPRQLVQNAGFDSTDVMAELRASHAQGKCWRGVNVDVQGTLDAFEAFIWEPALVKQNALAAATEAACVILSVDETIRTPKSEGLPNQGAPQMK